MSLSVRDPPSSTSPRRAASSIAGVGGPYPTGTVEPEPHCGQCTALDSSIIRWPQSPHRPPPAVNSPGGGPAAVARRSTRAAIRRQAWAMPAASSPRSANCSERSACSMYRSGMPSRWTWRRVQAGIARRLAHRAAEAAGQRRLFDGDDERASFQRLADHVDVQRLDEPGVDHADVQSLGLAIARPLPRPPAPAACRRPGSCRRCPTGGLPPGPVRSAPARRRAFRRWPWDSGSPRRVVAQGELEHRRQVPFVARRGHDHIGKQPHVAQVENRRDASARRRPVSPARSSRNVTGRFCSATSWKIWSKLRCRKVL